MYVDEMRHALGRLSALTIALCAHVACATTRPSHEPSAPPSLDEADVSGPDESGTPQSDRSEVAKSEHPAGQGGPPSTVDDSPQSPHPPYAGHPHEHSRCATRTAPPSDSRGARPTVIPHAGLRAFGNNGNTLVGIATPSQGAKSFEVWRTSVAVGSKTPLHRHASEEVFVFLQGRGRARIGSEEFDFEAPATVIAPAGVPHQFFNVGDVPTDAIVVVGISSPIYDGEGKEMNLPWRK